MQCDAPVLLTAARAILHITLDGVPGSTKLRPDLVERTALRAEFDQGVSIPIGKAPDVEDELPVAVLPGYDPGLE